MRSIWPVRIAVKRTDESGIGRYTTSSRCGSPASQYPSNRLSVRWSSFTHSTKRKGPVPTGLRAKSSLYFSTAARETIIPARSVDTDNRGANRSEERRVGKECRSWGSKENEREMIYERRRGLRTAERWREG